MLKGFCDELLKLAQKKDKGPSEIIARGPTHGGVTTQKLLFPRAVGTHKKGGKIYETTAYDTHAGEDVPPMYHDKPLKVTYPHPKLPKGAPGQIISRKIGKKGVIEGVKKKYAPWEG